MAYLGTNQSTKILQCSDCVHDKFLKLGLTQFSISKQFYLCIYYFFSPPLHIWSSCSNTSVVSKIFNPSAPSGGYDSSAFELELSGQHQEQYSRQFSSSPESEATDRDQQYAELISSPDVSNQEVSGMHKE